MYNYFDFKIEVTIFRCNDTDMEIEISQIPVRKIPKVAIQTSFK